MGRPRKAPGESFPIPEWYLEEHPELPDGFQFAFDHARRHNNPDKAALLYAEARHQDYTDAAKEE